MVCAGRELVDMIVFHVCVFGHAARGRRTGPWRTGTRKCASLMSFTPQWVVRRALGISTDAGPLIPQSCHLGVILVEFSHLWLEQSRLIEHLAPKALNNSRTSPAAWIAFLLYTCTGLGSRPR